MTEREMLELLHRRFGPWSGGLTRYVNAEHVRARAGFYARTADFVAVATCRSDRYEIHGVEVKVSRGDWLRELRDPGKAESHRAWCHHWWLAVPHTGIVKPGELPPGWGLLVAQQRRSGPPVLVAKVRAGRREVAPIPPESLASLLRAVAKTAAKRASE